MDRPVIFFSGRRERWVADFSPANLIGFNGHVLMSGTVPEIGNELWIYDPVLRQENEDNIESTTKAIAYPNPFSDMIHIDLSNWSEKEKEIQVSLTDLSGHMIERKPVTVGQEINIGNTLKNGFYWIELKGTNRHQIIPVIKQD